MIRAFSGRARESERIVSTRTYVPPSSILTLLVLLTLGWGVNWPIMKVVMAEMPPLHFRALCLAVGAAGLFAIARANRLPIRVPPGAWLRLIVITLFNVAAWNVLAVYGVTFMESGRAAILAYTFPVWGVLLGVWVLREPVTGSRLAGVVLGVLGMLVLLGDEIHAVGRSPTGALLLIASARKGVFRRSRSRLGPSGGSSTTCSSARSSATGPGSRSRRTRRSAFPRSPR